MSEKFVKVAKLNSGVQEFYMDNGQTVGDAIQHAGHGELSGYEVRLNGVKTSRSTELSDGDIITLVPKVKAGNN